jgi:hypothetical protein
MGKWVGLPTAEKDAAIRGDARRRLVGYKPK